VGSDSATRLIRCDARPSLLKPHPLRWDRIARRNQVRYHSVALDITYQNWWEMPWNARLRHPIPLSDSRVLRTLADARDMVLSLPERDQREDKWQVLAKLLMSAAQADNLALTAIVTHRIQEALRRPPFTVVRLAIGIEKKPPAPSVRKRSKAKARRDRRIK
jgi:hypothetical protein